MPKSRKSPTLPYDCPITPFPLLSSLMLLSSILVLLLILTSHSPTTSPTSPAPASCTYVISTASDPCLTLKLHPPLPPFNLRLHRTFQHVGPIQPRMQPMNYCTI